MSRGEGGKLAIIDFAGCDKFWVANIGSFYFERRVRRLLAESAEASVHVSSTPDSRAMTRCPLAILNNILNKSDGNRGVANVVSVVATFPVRLRILRVVCGFCVLIPYFMISCPPILSAPISQSVPLRGVENFLTLGIIILERKRRYEILSYSVIRVVPPDFDGGGTGRRAP